MPDSHKSHQPKKRTDLPYRKGVGIALFNAEGRVFVGCRIDNPGAWQMPQGGIDEGEDPMQAVFREMEEEIGTRQAEIIDAMEEWISYEFPYHVAKKLGWTHRGQSQKWIALKFKGSDSDIRLDAHETPEFMDWKWVDIKELLSIAVPFKRDVYGKIMQRFSVHAEKDK